MNANVNKQCQQKQRDLERRDSELKINLTWERNLTQYSINIFLPVAMFLCARLLLPSLGMKSNNFLFFNNVTHIAPT